MKRHPEIAAGHKHAAGAEPGPSLRSAPAGMDASDEEAFCMNIVKPLLQENVRRIANSADLEGSVAVERMKSENGRVAVRPW